MKKLKYFIFSVLYSFCCMYKKNDKYNFELSEITQRDQGKANWEIANKTVLINYNDIDEFGKRAIERLRL